MAVRRAVSASTAALTFSMMTAGIGAATAADVDCAIALVDAASKVQKVSGIRTRRRLFCEVMAFL